MVYKKIGTKRKVWLIVLVVVIVLAAIAIHIATGPVHGQPTQSGAEPVVVHHQAAPQAAASNIQTDYFSLALPTGYRQQASLAVLGLLYSQTLIKTADFGSLVITISLKSMPDGGLDGDSNYRLRAQQSSRYSLTSQTVKGDKVTVTNDNQSAAVTAFWPHGGYLATISASSGLENPAADGNSDELAALQPLLQAWQWR